MGANAEKQRALLTFTSFADFDTTLRHETPFAYGSVLRKHPISIMRILRIGERKAFSWNNRGVWSKEWIDLFVVSLRFYVVPTPLRAPHVKPEKKKKLTVGLEPTTSGLEVQCAIQLRHASSTRHS